MRRVDHPFGGESRFDVGDGLIDVAVDDAVPILRGDLPLPPGDFEPAANVFGRVGVPGGKTTLQFLLRFRFDEEGQQVRAFFPDGLHPFDVDFQDDRLSFVQSSFDLIVERAVPVTASEDFFALEKLAGSLASFELCVAEEAVVDAVDLARTRLSRGR